METALLFGRGSLDNPKALPGIKDQGTRQDKTLPLPRSEWNALSFTSYSMVSFKKRRFHEEGRGEPSQEEYGTTLSSVLPLAQ